MAIIDDWRKPLVLLFGAYAGLRTAVRQPCVGIW